MSAADRFARWVAGKRDLVRGAAPPPGGGRRRELLIGCGSRRDRILPVGWQATWAKPWDNLTTLDMNPDHRPDVVWNLEDLPYPFEDSTFHEVHAYEVLEHLGRAGEFRSLLAQFAELWRILRPGGRLYATCPSWRSMWAWGDPGHTRVLTSGTLAFLSQEQYREQVGKTPMSDYRFCYSADFRPVFVHEDEESFWFGLEALKPGQRNA